MPEQKLKNPSPDYRTDRCGHGFYPHECPYEFCGYRDTLKVLRDLTDSLSQSEQKSARLTIEEQADMVREQAAAAGMTPEQFAKAYNDLTPEQIKAALRDRELRELDFKVARIVGATPTVDWNLPIYHQDAGKSVHRRYSTSADAALSAYEVMQGRGWFMVCAEQVASFPGWTVCIGHNVADDPMDLDSKDGDGATFAEALCRAIVAAAALEGR